MELGSAQLMLETGEVFPGQVLNNQQISCCGEVVFNTGMTGYVESLTDPSYAGQILVFTYPLIGNYGVSAPSTWESSFIHAAGVVLSEIAQYYSNPDAERSLSQWLQEQNIPCLTGVDTRALTTHIRTKGVISGAITSQQVPSPLKSDSAIHWVKQVTIKEPHYYGRGEKNVILVDCGSKESILRLLLTFPIRIKRVPYNYDFTEEPFDGVLISNGPGDPTQCTETIAVLRKAFLKQKPMFGICLGTQLMALAAGATTCKLPFGHRSHNQPCIDLASQQCYLTSQNHGYAVEEQTLPPDWRVTFRNLNDQSVEGIAHKQLPFFAVQFHPESAPGPMDTQWLFKTFFDLL
jgi:carbamoyl-phosphate synthase small subunit